MEGFDLVWKLATEYFLGSFAVLLALVAFFYFKAGQWVSALTFLGFGVVLAAGEGASVYYTGKTISENHWYMDATNADAGMTLNLLLTGLLLIIVVHLAKISIQRYLDSKKPGD